jgi:hypothetical protein
MTKFLSDTVLDGPKGVIDDCTRQVVCSAAPANFAGIAAVALADVTMASPGDYTAADGDVSGRKTTVAAKSTVTVDASGTATHTVLDNGSVLHVTTEVTSQALTAANTVNIPAWDIEFRDPT